MRKITTLLLVGLTLLFAAEGFAQRGIGTNLPEKSSVLELKSETRGLLIPRVELTQTTLPAPVTAPANSLLVYNTIERNDVRPGYYYWDQTLNGGVWAALLDSKSAGKNIKIDPDGTISIDPGADAGKVLVTVEDDSVTPSVITSEWVDVASILGQLLNIEGENGITVLSVVEADGSTTYTVELGGALTKETIINTNANNFEVKSGGDKFIVSGLNTIEVGADGNITGLIPEEKFKDTFDVLIVNKTTGLVQRVSVKDLLNDVIAVRNGMYYDPVDGFIKLGGALTENTEIDLDAFDFTIKTDEETANLKIEGLTETTSPAAANQIMVVDENNNVRTVRRVISKDITSSVAVADADTDYVYSAYVQEVNITVSQLGSAVDLTLPAASTANEGQVINVTLTIANEAVNYLTIKDTTGDLTWGALPFQGWVLKSNGTKWLIVSSN